MNGQEVDRDSSSEQIVVVKQEVDSEDEDSNQPISTIGPYSRVIRANGDDDMECSSNTGYNNPDMPSPVIMINEGSERQLIQFDGRLLQDGNLVILTNSPPGDLQGIGTRARLIGTNTGPNTNTIPKKSTFSQSEVQQMMKKISPEQRELMLDFMMMHPELAFGKGDNKEQLLQHMANCLNSKRNGCFKTPDKWQKSWRDWKCDVRVKVKTLGRPALNPLEERLLTFLEAPQSLVQSLFTDSKKKPGSSFNIKKPRRKKEIELNPLGERLMRFLETFEGEKTKKKHSVSEPKNTIREVEEPVPAPVTQSDFAESCNRFSNAQQECPRMIDEDIVTQEQNSRNNVTKRRKITEYIPEDIPETVTTERDTQTLISLLESQLEAQKRQTAVFENTISSFSQVMKEQAQIQERHLELQERQLKSLENGVASVNAAMKSLENYLKSKSN